MSTLHCWFLCFSILEPCLSYAGKSMEAVMAHG